MYPCHYHDAPIVMFTGTPWTPAPVAEDYEETITILLDSNKVEDALDIFARMVKRGFRPSTEVN